MMLRRRAPLRARPPRAAAIAITVACALASPTARAGKLGRASDAARNGSSSSAGTNSSWSTGGSTSCSSSDDEQANALLLAAVFSPWLVPNALVEAKRLPGAAAGVRFADYPYAHGASGLLVERRPAQALLERDDVVDAGPPVAAPSAPVDSTIPAARKPFALEFGAEAAIGVDEDVVRSGFHARALFPYRLGIDTSWSLYRELHGTSPDQLGLGREHLDIRFAESEHVHFWTGIGPQHLVDSKGWVNGFDLTWAFQAFPGNPFVVSAEASVGVLGKAFAPGLRGEVGLMLDRFEVSAGYEERWVGPVALGGPLVSLTAWF